MKVMVTGGGGFIGSHLVQRLLDDGYEVSALVRYSSTGTAGFLEPLREHPALQVHLGDVADARLVREVMEPVDAVLHLAALIGIPYSYRAPSSYVGTNIAGTMSVLEAARDLGTARVVLTSTSEVYGTAVSTPITEDHPKQAQSPYSATKIAADALGEAWARAFSLPVVILRPFNTYGPRQSARAIVPTILRQLATGSDSIELGSLWPQRDFTYVDDTVAGFLAAMTAVGIEGSTIHLGTGTAVSIAELVELCQDVADRRVTVRHDERRDRPDASEVGLLLSDPSLARELLGWAPTTSLRDGLERTWQSILQTPGPHRGEYAT
jgi:NAD dependent epimerase/dehydratase